MRGETRSQKKDWKFRSFELRSYLKQVSQMPASGSEKNARPLERTATKVLSDRLSAAFASTGSVLWQRVSQAG